jgi:DNA-directed RNA polymerase specialized sigma24 family protein
MALVLFDVRDTEAFCWRIVRSSNLELSYHEAEDLCAYLVACAWEFSLRYEPKRGVFFTRYLQPRLRNKTIDWVRKERGRTRWVFTGGRVHERQRPELVSLDHELVDTLPARTGDPANGGDPDFGRLVAERDRRRAGDLERLGLEAPRRA